MIFRRARVGVALASVLPLACKSDKPVPADSVAAATPPPLSAPAAAVNTGWEESAGSFMLEQVPGNTARARVILPLLPDTMLSGPTPIVSDSLSGAKVDLLSRRGAVGSASIVLGGSSASGETCPSWPEANLTGEPGKAWTIGFASGTVAPLPLDSLEGMSSGDSSNVVSELARMSSAVVEGNDPAFGGLPFVVRKAYRFSIGGESVLVGDVVRKINEEANPREERVLLAAEKSTSGNESYSTVFHTRVAGTEDAVRTTEILGAIRFVKTSRPAIVVSFEYDEGGRLALLQRINRRVWRISWRGAYAGCR